MKKYSNRKNIVKNSSKNFFSTSLSNKRGAIEMSLNLIIMLIIGMVVLGLVIGFVNSLVNKGTANFDKQLGANQNLKLSKVKTCPDIFCILPSPSITMKKGTNVNVFIKIRNVGTNTLTINAGDATNTLITSEGVQSAVAGNTGTFTLAGPGFDLAAGTEDAQMYTLTVNPNTPIGTYYIPFGITMPDGTVYKKVITVNVQ